MAVTNFTEDMVTSWMVAKLDETNVTLPETLPEIAARYGYFT